MLPYSHPALGEPESFSWGMITNKQYDMSESWMHQHILHALPLIIPTDIIQTVTNLTIHQPPTSNWHKIKWIVCFSDFLLYVAWKRGLPWKCARFVLFRLIKKRSFNLLCDLDLIPNMPMISGTTGETVIHTHTRGAVLVQHKTTVCKPNRFQLACESW